MELYDQISYDFSKRLTRKYSTSFSLGIHMLDSKFHDSIYAIYGFVRVADEIVDTFHQHDKEKLFRRFCEDYIYGSAEVVGLMCLKVFCQGDEKNYEKLVAPARSLGSAFQKINFLRDFKSDFAERGRVYFPGIDFNNFTNDQKKEIEKEIEKEFNDAWKGVIKLPNGSKLGVSVAYIYYVTLFKKIRRIPANKIKSERIRINNIQKIILLIQTWFRYNLRLI